MIDVTRRLGPNARNLLAVASLAVLTLGIGLGRSGRLTYHEAIAAQAAREMIASGDPVVPTLGGRPWLEKPPLMIWMIALGSAITGGVSEVSARFPSAIAAGALALSVGWFATRRFGKAVGLLSGLIQATTVWTVTRGRLAEADMPLAAIVTITLIAFDLFRREANAETVDEPRLKRTRWAFFLGLGLTSLAKGIGFGAALVLAIVGLVLLLDRDRKTLTLLKFWPGWSVAAAVALAWPLLVLRVEPSAISLWFLHVSDRFADEPRNFDSQTWLAYSVAILGYLLPWTPLALIGAIRALPRVVAGRWTPERFLFAWTVAPLALLSIATIKHAHYAIHALPPCSIWAAFGVVRLGERLQNRGVSPQKARRIALGGFVGLGLAYGVGFAMIGPWLDRRGVEWAFYETLRPKLRQNEPVVLLYNVPDWDREPYQTPFGPFPHDLAVRLYYLQRPTDCQFGVTSLKNDPKSRAEFAVIGRDADLDGLKEIGEVETLAESPKLRFDREYKLFRVTPRTDEALAKKADEARSTR